MENPVLLEYYHIVVRLSDHECLAASTWVSDTIITLYYKYLERTLVKYRDDVELIPPTVAHRITRAKLNSDADGFDDDDADLETLLPEKLKEKSLIFCPINSSEEQSIQKDTHWSLLVYSRFNKYIYYYDTSKKGSTDNAQCAIKNLAWWLRIQEPTLETIKVQKHKMVQHRRKDESDSGIYVILFTECLVKRYLGLHNMVGTDIALSFCQDKALWDLTDDKIKTPTKQRLEIKVLIHELQVGGRE